MALRLRYILPGAALLALGFGVARSAQADGVPVVEPLIYAGSLEEGGALVASDDRRMAVMAGTASRDWRDGSGWFGPNP